MGIPMDDDIHNPTVPSGPTSVRTDRRDLSKLSLAELFHEKDRLEVELKALSAVLESVRYWSSAISVLSLLVQTS
jgi:26S proteasome non-ATPase regulatory subunit 9